MNKCELCTLKKLSKWYYEDDKVVICDCLSCKVPMIVLRKHTVKPTVKEIEYVLELCKKMFGDNISLRTQQRKIPDHFHWHIF